MHAVIGYTFNMHVTISLYNYIIATSCSCWQVVIIQQVFTLTAASYQPKKTKKQKKQKKKQKKTTARYKFNRVHRSCMHDIICDTLCNKQL